MLNLPFASSVLITGGPGRGKTSIIKAMVNQAFVSGSEIVLATIAQSDYTDEYTAGQIHRLAVTTEKIEQEIGRLHETLEDRQIKTQTGENSPSIYFFLDETPYILRDLRGRGDSIARLLQLVKDGPGVNIYVVAAGQQFVDEVFEGQFQVVIDTNRDTILSKLTK